MNQPLIVIRNCWYFNTFSCWPQVILLSGGHCTSAFLYKGFKSTNNIPSEFQFFTLLTLTYREISFVEIIATIVPRTMLFVLPWRYSYFNMLLTFSCHKLLKLISSQLSVMWFQESILPILAFLCFPIFAVKLTKFVT